MIFTSLENSVSVEIMYPNFMKAFDKSDHGFILSRSRAKGIVEKVGIWLYDYPSGRRQAVMANNKISTV